MLPSRYIKRSTLTRVSRSFLILILDPYYAYYFSNLMAPVSCLPPLLLPVTSVAAGILSPVAWEPQFQAIGPLNHKEAAGDGCRRQFK